MGCECLKRTTSARLSKFVIHSGTLDTNFESQKGTSNFMILVPLFDLKLLNEFAAIEAGISNRRH